MLGVSIFALKVFGITHANLDNLLRNFEKVSEIELKDKNKQLFFVLAMN